MCSNEVNGVIMQRDYDALLKNLRGWRWFFIRRLELGAAYKEHNNIKFIKRRKKESLND